MIPVQIQESADTIIQRIDWIQDQIRAGNLKVAQDEFEIVSTWIDLYEESINRLVADNAVLLPAQEESACTVQSSSYTKPRSWYDQFLDPR